MAQFTVRNFDEKLYNQLKKRAKNNHRSLEAEVKVMLSSALPPPRRALTLRQREERLRRFAAIRNSVKPSKIDLVATIREDRDRE